MLKSRALILSGSNNDNESWAPCCCQQTDRQTQTTRRAGPFCCNSSFPQPAPFKLTPLHPFSAPPFSFIPLLHRDYLPLPRLLTFMPPPFLSFRSLLKAAVFLFKALPPPTNTTHTHTLSLTCIHHTPALPSDIDKWRLTEMTTSLLMFSSDTT